MEELFEMIGGSKVFLSLPDGWVFPSSSASMDAILLQSNSEKMYCA